MSRWSGFHRLDRGERIRRIAQHAGLDEGDVASLSAGLAVDDAEGFVENVVGHFALPLGVAVGFVIDGADVVVPMAVEESSVVAAASHGAKLAAQGGGFHTAAADPVTIGQIEVRDVADPDTALLHVSDAKADWLDRLQATIPRMIKRGGGVRDIVARRLGADRVVVHILVDTRDAMGANLTNTLCEAIGEDVAAACGGRLGLRILSNLADERLVTARCSVPVEALGGSEVATAIVEANDFAELDPHRAATHNKGIMNGIDPVVVATGNDWRAVEAGAHAYAAQGGYGPLTSYRVEGGSLHASLTLPLAVGTVGGVTALHPTARVCMKILGDPDATTLARTIAAVGLAQNLSAMRALATEGIQRGHMALHARNVAMQAGLQGDAAARVAQQMVKEGHVNLARAQELAKGTP